MIAKSSK